MCQQVDNDVNFHVIKSVSARHFTGVVMPILRRKLSKVALSPLHDG